MSTTPRGVPSSPGSPDSPATTTDALNRPGTTGTEMRRDASRTSTGTADGRHAFDYAVVRVVPRVERQEFVNVGVLLHCPTLEFLGARVVLDAARVAALAPEVTREELEQIEQSLGAIPLICAGGEAAGALGRMPASARFHWLVAPRSHVIQTSPVHAGLCTDPAVALEHLLRKMVPSRA